MKAAKVHSNDLTVGTRAEVHWDDMWQPGIIVECFYSLSSFPEGFEPPSVVRLDKGSKLIFVPKEAVRLLPCFFDKLNEDLQNMIVWATTEGGLVKPAAALRGVNKKLRTMVEDTRTWHNEWVAAWTERAELMGIVPVRSKYEAGGHLSIEKTTENVAPNIKWKVEQGWPRAQAEAYTLITCALKAPLSAAVRDRSDADPAVRARSDRYAASTQVVREALAQRAKHMTKPAPLAYRNLTGFAGLATEDLAWAALTQPEASPGLTLVTHGVVQGIIANPWVFPDDKGFCVSVSVGGKHTFELQDSDVVCFRSAAADADGYHSLIPTGGLSYEMPPLATVTLEKVEQPGEWEVRGHKVQRRLFTVRVTYK